MKLMVAQALADLARIEQPTDPIGFLRDIIAQKWTLSADGGQITSASENGKSVTVSIPPGMSQLELMALARMAIGVLYGQHRARRIKTRFGPVC